ncbi:hypothetical protein OsJ_36156 [Oryza sativa Japonica Group]|uniref:F-box associated beta-propeller type 3 domain-containing protein n=1 Tax=Oryza sativa subsp. japonica TaxID=39947 RepID=A3CHI1_ORYSJ|nr:hypothetical protein OsJ_36156 [Oryza sativa Japonica Group]
MEDYLPTDAFVKILLRLPPPLPPRLPAVAGPARRAHAADPRPRQAARLLHARPPRGAAWVLRLRLRRRPVRRVRLLPAGLVRWRRRGGGAHHVRLPATASLAHAGRTHRRHHGSPTRPPGETLAVPPPPRLPRNCAFHRTAVGFGYHPTTGRYKVVHLPVRGKPSAFGLVEVFTLRGSNATWREVVAAPPPAGSSCDVDCGLVSVDGAMYWIAMGRGADAIMSFDLEHERVAHVTSLPAMARRKLAAGRCCHLTGDIVGALMVHYGVVVAQAPTAPTLSPPLLTVIQRRLAVAITASDVTVIETDTPTVEVWVLHKGRRKQRWINQYRVVGMDTYHKQLTRPYFFFSHGEHYMIITWRFPYISMRAHRLKKGDGEPKEMALLEQGTSIQVFSYVETTETLR